MDRREAIKRTSLMLGYAVSAPVMAAVLKGCKAKPDLNYKAIFFSEDQARLVGEIAETIIPRTSTPGAKDVGVPGFIDSMIHEVYPKQDQESFIKGLTEFDSEAKTQYGHGFVECTPEEQLAFVKGQNEKALTQSSGGASEGWWAAGAKGDKPFILKVKELTLIGFFTSEPGATQVLQYNQVPGPFRGCVPLAEVGKAWAT
jgi:gluconate 2-dehydrogenase gamma chain